MKKILFPIIMLTVATVFLAAMPTEAEAAIYDDTVRLHILANSDSEEDQALKLKVRDAVLEEYGTALSQIGNVTDAEDFLSSKAEEIEAFAESKVRELGYEYAVEVTFGNEWYGTRYYENFSLPQGNYNSLRICIGDAEGQNWWCVMFPPLCLDAATADIPYSDAEYTLITNKYNVKFKILELLTELSN